MRTARIALLAGMLALALAMPGLASPAPNLLVNPSFEADGLVGDFTAAPYAPTGWTDWSDGSDYNWQGVYDSAWKNPNCNFPAWPDPVHQPVDGSYFLAKWMPPQNGCEWHDGTGGGSGCVYQTIDGLVAGQTYYFSVWAATNHPHGTGLARIVALPQAFDGTDYTPPLHDIYPVNTPFMDANPVPSYASTGRAAAPAEEEDTGGWPYYGANWASSDERWSKLTCEVTIPQDKNACTVFLVETTSSNNLAEPQYIQMDAARFATTQLLEIKNVQITSVNPTGATIEWDVYDGGNRVTNATTYVSYGTTTAYGSTAAGMEPDPVLCHEEDPNNIYKGNPGHYMAVLSGLTTSTEYHFCIQVDAGNYQGIESWTCDPYTITDYNRDYESAQSDDVFPLVPNPAISITNIAASNVTQDSATITWNTNVAASSQVNYGRFGDTSGVDSDPALVTSHSMTLTGLLGNTSYSYSITAAADGYSTTTSTVKTFNTLPGPNIMNGDFEYDGHNGAKAKYWTDVPMKGALSTRLDGEFSMPAHSGNWCYGLVTNGSAPDSDGFGCYQQIATNPGDIISVYAWSFASAQGQGGGSGAPHRFGENNNQIGVDPTGGKPNLFVSYPSNIVWGGELSSIDWRTFLLNKDARTGDYRRLAVCAVAENNLATVYLRTRAWWANAWLFNAFDDVTVEPPTEVQSVGALKALPMQTNVNLTQGDFVVTYVQDFNSDMDENNGQPYFYIQDRTKGGAGIKVTIGERANWPSWIDLGQKIEIVGTLDWGIFNNLRFGNIDQQARMDKPAGEMVLRAVKITNTNQTASLPEPVGVTNFTLGGGSSADPYFTNAGVAGGSGANNVGMRVRTWGKIVEIGYDYNYWVYMVVDDGSKLALPPAAPMAVEGVEVSIDVDGDGDPDRTTTTGSMVKTSKISDFQHEPGLYVQTWDGMWPTHDDGTAVAVGDYVILTGISGVRLDLDTDDHQCLLEGTDPEAPELTPEAEKNMRCIKLDWVDGAKYIKLQ